MSGKENHEIVLRQSSRSPTPTRTSNSTDNSRKRQSDSKLNLYTSFIVKILFLLFIGYLIITVFISISDDVKLEVERQNELEMQRIKKCQEEYEENRCRENKFPALQERCKLLLECINSPRQGVGKSKVAVRYIATLFNELINPLSPKTVVLFALIIVFVVWFPKFL